MKQSIGLIILQIISIVLGLVSVFWVAGSLDAQEYAIVGVYHIIISILITFSNTGIETYAIRNVLAWKDEGKLEQIKLVVTQAITYRTILSCILFLPLLAYAFYISNYKYDGHHLDLFILMILLSIPNATNDSIVLILKAFNKYLSASMLNFIVNVFGRIIALILFVRYGFTVYIYTIVLLPLIILAPFLFKLREYISFKGVFSKVNLYKSIVESKYFATSSYISFANNYIDQFLVSIFLNPEILGSFTLAKSIFSMGKTFIENIFDPMIQNLVRYKIDFVLFKKKLAKIFKIKTIVLTIMLIGIPIVYFATAKLLILLNINHYLHLNNYINLIYIAIVFSVASKVKFNYIMLFYSQQYYLKLILISSIASMIFFIIVNVIDSKLLFLHILLTNIVMFVYTERIFKNPTNPLNNEICSTR